MDMENDIPLTLKRKPDRLFEAQHASSGQPDSQQIQPGDYGGEARLYAGNMPGGYFAFPTR